MIGYDQIDFASVTDPGLRRQQNEDNQAVLAAVDAAQWQQQGHVFLVADGMGGHAVGELASELAANIIPHTYQKYAADGSSAALRKAFLEANASIHARGMQNREFKGMGTTATVLVLRPDGAWIGHVGDSRAYRVRGDVIEQLTFDHSWLWELAKRQKVHPDQLKGVASNFINRSLGPDPLVQIDIEGPHPVQSGDRYVLCSDGLSNQLSDTEIGAIIRVLEPAEAAPLLVHLANLRGGPDNITVVAVRVAGEIATSPAAVPAISPRAKPNAAIWPAAALFLGVVLAIQAAVLSTSEGSPWGKWAFALAALSIAAGLVGLVRHLVHQRGMPHPMDNDEAIRVYRQTPCRIDGPLAQRIGAAAASLRAWGRETEATVNWQENQGWMDRADAALAANDWETAFREYCLAMRPLAEYSSKTHRSGNGTQLHWEKTVVA